MGLRSHQLYSSTNNITRKLLGNANKSTFDQPFSAGITATGTYTPLTPGNGYQYYLFTGPGSITFGKTGNIDYLVVGGGGGGAGNGPGPGAGGGGGAGGAVGGTNFSIASGPYTITVGTAGPGAPYPSTSSGTSGNASSIGPYALSGITTAFGGGGGGGPGLSPGAQPGGSGGGAGATPPAPSATLTGGSGTPGQGYPGGSYGSGAGSGGGGAGGAGGNGGTSGANGGNGGPGAPFPAFPGPLFTPMPSPWQTAVGPTGLFAGGGGGYSSGAGGPGGGGSVENDGITNTGGGGGGPAPGNTPGRTGGPGIVIIRVSTT